MDGDWQTYYVPAARVIVQDYGHWNKELGINIAGIYGRTHPSIAVSPLPLSVALIAHFSPLPSLTLSHSLFLSSRPLSRAPALSRDTLLL